LPPTEFAVKAYYGYASGQAARGPITAEEEQARLEASSMVIERPRNRAQDLRSYHLEYWEGPWPKDERLRQIVVQATNPKGQTIQVSILTDDTQRAATQIVQLMFCRWIQENDFKYLDKHFGINQITSYGATGYEQLREQVQDRQVRSVEAKVLQEQRRQLRARQGRLLLLQAKGQHEAAKRQKRSKNWNKRLLPTKANGNWPDCAQCKHAGKVAGKSARSRLTLSARNWPNWNQTPRRHKRRSRDWNG
jgi:hypothetical protein